MSTQENTTNHTIQNMNYKFYSSNIKVLENLITDFERASLIYACGNDNHEDENTHMEDIMRIMETYPSLTENIDLIDAAERVEEEVEWLIERLKEDMVILKVFKISSERIDCEILDDLYSIEYLKDLPDYMHDDYQADNQLRQQLSFLLEIDEEDDIYQYFAKWFSTPQFNNREHRNRKELLNFAVDFISADFYEVNETFLREVVGKLEELNNIVTRDDDDELQELIDSRIALHEYKTPEKLREEWSGLYEEMSSTLKEMKESIEEYENDFHTIAWENYNDTLLFCVLDDIKFPSYDYADSEGDGMFSLSLPA